MQETHYNSLASRLFKVTIAFTLASVIYARVIKTDTSFLKRFSS